MMFAAQANLNFVWDFEVFDSKEVCRNRVAGMERQG